MEWKINVKGIGVDVLTTDSLRERYTVFSRWGMSIVETEIKLVVGMLDIDMGAY